MKKLLLFIALIISGLGLNAQTQYDVNGYGKFTITSINPPECRLERSDYTQNESYIIPEAVVINSTVYFVTSIGNSVFSFNRNLKSIVIPKEIREIGEGAFWGCPLSSLTFEENSQLTKIGKQAFRDIKLSDIVIPKSVTYIGEEAFCIYGADPNLTTIKTVTFEEGSQLTYIGKDAFRNHDDLHTVNFEVLTKLETIESSAFYECSSLMNVNFRDYSQLKTIGEYAFYRCSSLLSLNFGDNSQLTTIVKGAFIECSGLFSVDFGDNSKLETIGEYAFENCSGLKNINFEDNSQLTTIEYYTFGWCSSLTSLSFGYNSQLTTIG